MQLGPTPSLSNNLTIALIERERANPVQPNYWMWRRVNAEPTGLASACQLPPGAESPSCGRPSPDEQRIEFAHLLDICRPERQDEPTYHPHRIPVPQPKPTYDCFGEQTPVVDRPFDRLIDVYA